VREKHAYTYMYLYVQCYPHLQAPTEVLEHVLYSKGSTALLIPGLCFIDSNLGRDFSKS
jgi:hypothetical protein